MSSPEPTRDVECISQRDESCDKRDHNLNKNAKKALGANLAMHAKINNINSTVAAKKATADNLADNEKLKIKEKIVKVKRTFNKLNKQFNDLSSEQRSQDHKNETRPRSSSVRSTRSAEGAEIKETTRSYSTSLSTTSVLSLEGVGETINEEQINKGPENSKKPRRRNKRNVVDNKQKVLPSQLCRDLNLNAEALLILDLLALPEEAREEFLITMAIKNRIFVEDPKTHSFELHPKIKKLEEVLNKNNGKLLNYIKKNPKLLQQKATKMQQSVQKEKKKLLYEDYVNLIVQNGLTEEQQQEFKLPYSDDRSRNYFHSKKFTESLETFAQKCVDAQLGMIIEGEVKVNAKNNEQAFVSYGDSDVMFPWQVVRKCALHGDVVRAFVRLKSGDSKDATINLNISSDATPEEELDEPLENVPERNAKGFVIKILEEVHNRRCVGSFLSYRTDCEYIMFIPRDTRLPNVKIFRENWPDFIKNNMEKIQEVLYVVEITGWYGEVCVGKILKPVGKCGELDSENEAILIENKLSINPYDDKINKLFYGPIILTDEEKARREDLRSECIFTIDPLTARDLDDAMSCKSLPNGNYEIGVHISDVAYFLREDSELDKIVQTRTTSVYMVNEVFHMLPKPLCLKCSLLPGEDKLAFSVFWEFSPEREILKTRFCRSIIKSCVQFAYEHAQKIIDNPSRDFTELDFPMIHNGFTAKDIVERVKVLQAIATILRQKRFDNGALRINRPKLYFELDPDSGAPINYGLYELNTANFLIEEFMLLANQSVAKFIYNKFPDISILRHHDPPKSRQMQELKEKLAILGLDLDISNSKSIYQSFVRLVSESEDPKVMEICLSHLISKCMTRALYFCSGLKGSEEAFKHYALSIPIYTHFTSPIRRYPDVLVHRVLSAALGYSEVPSRTPHELARLAVLCNTHKYDAKTAGDLSSQLYFLHYVKLKKIVPASAAILAIFKNFFEVILIETGHIVQVQFPKRKSGVKITAQTKTKPHTATLVYANESDTHPKELKIFSVIPVEIYENKNKIKACFAIPASSGSRSGRKSKKSKIKTIVDDLELSDSLCSSSDSEFEMVQQAASEHKAE